MIYLLFLQ